MIRNVVLTVPLVLSLTMASFGVPKQSSEERALRAELQRVFDALAQGDVDFFNDHYVPEVTRFHLGGVPLDVGWDAAKARGVQASFERGWRVHTDSYDVTDLRIYDDFAVTAGTAIARQTTEDGDTVQSDFRFSYFWNKQNGRWKELHHHVSPYNAPASRD